MEDLASLHLLFAGLGDHKGVLVGNQELLVVHLHRFVAGRARRLGEGDGEGAKVGYSMRRAVTGRYVMALYMPTSSFMRRA